MSAFPYLSDSIASAASDVPVYPEEDTLVSSRGCEETHESHEKRNAEAVFFDVVLPRATSVKCTKHAQRKHEETAGRVSSCSIPAQKQGDLHNKASGTAEESSSDVRVAQKTQGENSEGRAEAERYLQENVVDTEQDEKGGEEMEQPVTHTDRTKDDGIEKTCSSKRPAEANLGARRTVILSETIPRIVGGSSVDRHSNTTAAPMLTSSGPAAGCHTQFLQDVSYENGAIHHCSIEEEAAAVTAACTDPACLAVSVCEENDKLSRLGEGEERAEGGATVCVESERLHMGAEAAETVFGKVEAVESEGCQQRKSYTLPTQNDELANAEQGQLSCTATVAAGQSRVSCSIGRVHGTTTFRRAHPQVGLPAEQLYHQETLQDQACDPQEEAEKLQKANSVLAAEGDIHGSRVCEEKHINSVSRTVRGGRVGDSGTIRCEILEVSSAQTGNSGDEQQSCPPVRTESFKDKCGLVSSAKMRADVEKLTTYSQQRSRSLVSSRVQLVERGACAADGRQPPLKPLLLQRRDRVELKQEQVEKGNAAVAGRRDLCGDLVSRKGSVVERLRQRYERSTSGSSIGSAPVRSPVSDRAPSTTSVRAAENKPEFTWRRRQQEKLQAAQEAAVRTRAALGDGAASKIPEGFMFRSAGEGNMERQDSAGSADIGGVVECSRPPAEVAVQSETTLASESCKCSDSLNGAGDPMRKGVLTVPGGECLTVTSLKEMFERRKKPLEEGRQQQTHQLQHRVQQQGQETVRQPAQAVKLLRAQYERRNKDPLPCQDAGTTTSVPAPAKRPLRLPKQEHQVSEFTTNRQQVDSAKTSTEARTPVKCLREQYQRLLTAGGTTSPRVPAPATIVTSTNVKSARELLGSLDIVGRYGKPYWVAKAEGALTKDKSDISLGESSAAPERDGDISAEAVPPVARSADEEASRRDGSLTCNRSRDTSHHSDSSERTGSGRLPVAAEGVEGFLRVSGASGNGRALERGSDRTQRDAASVARKRETSVYLCSVVPKSRLGGREVADCSNSDKALHVETTERARPSQFTIGHSGEEQSPTVSAHASSKIGALATALGPACINFGKAPPRRLLTRAEPEAETEGVDPEIYGYAKAQEAIERRKRELKLLPLATCINEKEQGDACPAADATNITRSTQNGVRTRRSARGSNEQKCGSFQPEGEVSSISDDKKAEPCGASGSDREHSTECVRRRDSSSTGTDKKDGECGATGSDGEDSTYYVRTRDWSSMGSIGEAHKSSLSSEEAERSCSAAGQISNCSGTEERGPFSHRDDKNRSSGSGRTLSIYNREEPYTEEVNRESSGTGRTGCRRAKTAALVDREDIDFRSDTEAQDCRSGREAFTRGSHEAFESDQSGCSSPTATKAGDGSRDALQSREPSSRHCLHVPYFDRDETGRAPAKAVERKGERESGWLPPDSAELPAPAGGEHVDTEAHEQSVSGRRKGKIPARGRKIAAAGNEARVRRVEGTVIGAEHMAALGNALATADQTDLVRAEDELTVKEGSEKSKDGESSDDLASPVGERTHAFRSTAKDNDMKDELRPKPKETVMEGDYIYERLKASGTFAPTMVVSSVSEDTEENGGRIGVPLTRYLDAKTSGDEEEMKKWGSRDELKEAPVQGGISYRGVQAGNTLAPAVGEQGETKNAVEDGEHTGVAATRELPLKIEPCSEERGSYGEENYAGRDSAVDVL